MATPIERPARTHHLWCSRASAVLSSSSVAVFVDQSAEDLRSAHQAAGGRQLNRARLSWRSLFERAMRPVRVVVGGVLAHHVHELPLAEDQPPVEALTTNGADPPLGIGVGLRRTRPAWQHLDADVAEHGIKLAVNFVSRSRTTNRNPSACPPNASMKLRAC